MVLDKSDHMNRKLGDRVSQRSTLLRAPSARVLLEELLTVQIRPSPLLED